MATPFIIRIGDAEYIPPHWYFSHDVAHIGIDGSRESLLLLAAAVPGREAQVLFGDERDTVCAVGGVSPDQSVLTLAKLI